MMNDSHENFDLRMREMMEGAEIKAPRSAWRAVSSSLDAAQAATTAMWWRWPAMALAAAAVAAGIFLAGTSDKQYSMDLDAVAVVAPVSQESAADEENLPKGTEKKPIEKTVQGIRSVCPEEQSAPEFIIPQNGTLAGSGSSTREEKKESAGEKKSSSQQRPVREVVRNIGFDNSIEDGGKKHRRTQLYAQGFVGNNDHTAGFHKDFALMTPALDEQLFNGLNETTTSTYGIPVSLGLGVKFGLGSRFAVGTGVDYSLLTRSFGGSYVVDGSSLNTDVHHTMQYIGIPVNVYMNLLDPNRNICVYLHAGAEAEWCVSNKYHLLANNSDISKKVDRAQLSAGAGLGVDLRITDHLGLYLDPGIRYYFPSGQPKNIRTEKPFMATFSAGLRFNL